jgi:superfamily II DNA or RNA helicase
VRIEGEIRLEKDFTGRDFLIFDAEPHVMSRIRKVFENARNIYNQGRFTHRPIAFPLTLSACRDLLWLRERYNLDCAPSTLLLVESKAAEYDAIVQAAFNADKDCVYKISDQALKLALPIREHQIQFNNMFTKMKRMLLADKIGLGKTPSGISILTEPHARPAIVVVPANLCTQWDRELHRFLPDVTSHMIRGFKNYPLPSVDVVITSYNRLAPWQDVLLSEKHIFKTIIFDEVQELRHAGTGKRDLSAKLSERASFALGLSGTPIYNMGSEIWSIMDVIKPNCLGGFDDFSSEWCVGDGVLEPATLNHYLKTQGLMLRRSARDIGLTAKDPSKNVVTIDSDIEKLKEVENVAKMLALSVLSGNIGEDSESAREFDWKLRQATGVAKARPVAEFVKMVLEQENKVVLAGWHREVYDIWLKELKDHRVVMYTGSESSKEKDQAVKNFIEGDAQVFIMSLRSGAGLDGLQRVCHTVVFGELDWSPHVMDQLLGRVDRDGQTEHVQAYYLTIADGSDPFMLNVIGDKRSQHEGVVEGKANEANILKDVGGKDRVREMAKSYLESIGEEIPEAVPEDGLLGEIADLLRRMKLPTNTEEEMQIAVDTSLRENLKSDVTLEREFRLSQKSRLDFLAIRGGEKIAIECKIDSTKRASVYRQVRRYVEEGGITALILLAPWHGIASFKVDGTPVIIVDTTISQI